MKKIFSALLMISFSICVSITFLAVNSSRAFAAGETTESSCDAQSDQTVKINIPGDGSGDDQGDGGDQSGEV